MAERRALQAPTVVALIPLSQVSPVQLLGKPVSPSDHGMSFCQPLSRICAAPHSVCVAWYQAPIL